MGVKRGTPARVQSPGRGVFGMKLREARLAAGMPASAVGELVGATQVTVSSWELGKTRPTPTQVDQLAKLFDLDELPAPERLPRKSPPVGVTHGLRRAVSELKDPIPLTPQEEKGSKKSIEEMGDPDSEFSLRRLLRSAQYVADNLIHLKEQYEATLREMHRLEQRMEHGMTREQIEILSDKARRYDQMKELLGRKDV